MTEDFDAAAEPMGLADEAAETVAASDAKLNSELRTLAKDIYSRPDHDVVARKPLDGTQSIEDTLRQTMERIQARPELPVMPPLPGNPSIEATLKAQQDWDASPKSTQRGIAAAHKSLPA